MDIFAHIVQHALADDVLLHGLRQGVPGSQVHPLAGKTHDLDPVLFFHHGVVKGDFGQGVIFGEQILIIREIDELVGPFQHIFQLIGEYAAIPQSALSDVPGRHVGGGLFLEGFDGGSLVRGFRDDVAVLFRRVGGLDAHKHQIRFSLFSLMGQALQGLKVILVDVGVHGAHHHGFLRVNPHHIR